ncbi:hypothetical protein LWI28_022261 [Acer negundo]|uniref:Uncharacterized protein n=1 Tax=Acer negundo TaxID=4023 RepID=A0AAD5IK47_ACENE|nr:hypothetical protein LWI28_022261 [Acer negundo]KAK4843010.1 hypothetical protein QYF36_002734 [Acer negundo]
MNSQNLISFSPSRCRNSTLRFSKSLLKVSLSVQLCGKSISTIRPPKAPLCHRLTASKLYSQSLKSESTEMFHFH